MNYTQLLGDYLGSKNFYIEYFFIEKKYELSIFYTVRLVELKPIINPGPQAYYKQKTWFILKSRVTSLS
jgi:hypothetical protein